MVFIKFYNFSLFENNKFEFPNQINFINLNNNKIINFIIDALFLIFGKNIQNSKEQFIEFITDRSRPAEIEFQYYNILKFG